MSEQDPAKAEQSDQPKLFTLWDKYEDAAKHFNDLNMRWRLQAMGGLAGLTTLAGFVVGEQSTIVARLRAMIMFSGMLAFGWIGVALLDLCYYNELLYGAGRAIRKLEDKTASWSLPIDLSTHLDQAVYSQGRRMPRLFYALGFVPLALAFSWATCAYRSLPETELALVKPTSAASSAPPAPTAVK